MQNNYKTNLYFKKQLKLMNTTDHINFGSRIEDSTSFSNEFKILLLERVY